MQFTVAPLNDGGIGILIDGAVFKREGMMPVRAVIGEGYADGRARPFLGAGERLEVVVDEHVPTIP